MRDDLRHLRELAAAVIDGKAIDWRQEMAAVQTREEEEYLKSLQLISSISSSLDGRRRSQGPAAKKSTSTHFH